MGNLVQAISNNRCHANSAVYVVGANKDSHIPNVSAHTCSHTCIIHAPIPRRHSVIDVSCNS